MSDRSVLFATAALPFPPTTGGEQASAAFVSALRENSIPVTAIGYGRPGSVPFHSADMNLRVVRVTPRPIETKHAPVRTALWGLGALATGRPISVQKYVSREYSKAVLRNIEAEQPCCLLIDRTQMLWLAQLVRAKHPKLPIVVSIQNIESELYEKREARPWLRAILRREAKGMERMERRGFREATAVWTLTEHDAAAVKRLSGREAEVFELPARHDARHQRKRVFDLGLIGTWTWSENWQGLVWFIENVLPRLDPDIKIAIAGRLPRRAPSDDTRIVWRGFVDDPQEFLASCGVIVVPSVAGSGVQVKTLDALASGAPVVATSVAMRGIGGAPAWVSIADSPAAFADAIGQHLAGQTDWSASALPWADDRRRKFTERVRHSMAKAVRPWGDRAV